MNGLKALDEIWGYRTVATLAGYVEQPIKKVYKKEFAIIKKELKDNAKYEKAIEILKKNPLVIDFRTILRSDDYDEYLTRMGNYIFDDDTYIATEKEFKLFKEVLK